MKQLDKALFLTCTGKSLESLEQTGEKKAMETVMLGDRIRDRACNKEMIIFDSITHWNESLREPMEPKHHEIAYQFGLNFSQTATK